MCDLMSRAFALLAAGCLSLSLIGATLWASPVLAADAGDVDGALLAWLGSGGAVLAVAGVIATWGRTQQQIRDHDRRLSVVEAACSALPQRLASVEALLQSQDRHAAEHHREVIDRLAALDGRAGGKAR